MSVKDEQIKFIISEYPQSTDDNTEFCIRFWEMACHVRGVHFPEDLKKIIRDYKPEAVTRKRREFVESTGEQRNKETEHLNFYS